MFVIYKATNKVNGKSYIGQAVDFVRRKGVHQKSAEGGCQNIFHRAIRKYGWDAFEWTILFEDDDEDQAWMDWWEIRMIAKHGTLMPNGYNMTAGGKGIPKLVHTDETKQKISESAKGKPKTEEHRRKIAETLVGRSRGPFSEETKKRMSLAQTGKRLSEETKAKIRALYEGKSLEEIHGDEKAAEIREKLRRIKIGHHVSEETRIKISESQKGREFSEEHKQKLRNAKSLARFLRSGKKLDLTNVFSG